MSQVRRWHFALLGIATLAFAVGAPATAPAQHPCAGAGDVPSAQCKEWQKQQKLNLTCMENPQKPECKDWLQKQSQAGKTKRTRPVASGPGDELPSGGDRKSFKPGAGTKGVSQVQKGDKIPPDIPFAGPPGSKPGAAEKGIILQNPGAGVGTKGIILQNRGK